MRRRNRSALDKVSPRIQEILLQQQVNELFDNWLTDLRRQGDVEVLDPSLLHNLRRRLLDNLRGNAAAGRRERR